MSAGAPPGPGKPPRTQYARSGGVNIAYQVVGDGSRDLVFVPGWISHLELIWEDPGFTRLVSRLASFRRLLVFDKRGTGLSDRVSEGELPTLEQRMDDLRAVMDAAHSERATLFGISEGGPMSLLFAATYPERTEALVVYGSYAHWIQGPDDPWALPREQHERALRAFAETWGRPIGLHLMAPSVADDPDARSRWARFLRMGASPGVATALYRMNMEIDVRPVLASIRVPTLVLHRTGDRMIDVHLGRYLAEHIPGARLVELPGADHLAWVGDVDALADETQEFLTGARPAPEADRILATVLFTDIVGSTERAAALGDRPWRDLLARFHEAARREIARFRGHEVDSAGDGLFATFDGPARAVRCALALGDAVRPLGLELRTGLHTGECERLGEKVSGIAVHTGARVAALAGAGEVWVSSTVRDLVHGSGLRFAERGTHELKGIPGAWRLYAAEA